MNRISIGSKMPTFCYFSLVLFFLIARMSFGYAQSTEGHLWQDPNQPVEQRIEDLLSRMTVEEKCSQMVYNSPAIERLGIPAYNWWSEALHGVARMGRATVFPMPIAMAATFDSALIQQVATAISDEARAKFRAAQKLGNITQYGGLSFWSPNINIFRDPRWGRGMETFGEDPFLTATLGMAFVKGMQGDDPHYLKTAACAKHYVVHSGPEKIRHEFNALPPEKDFQETYLPAFQQLVQKSGVEAVMCAYNRTYDEPCCGSTYLLQDILRDTWGFQGHIVSDCWALTDFNQFHKVTGTNIESAVKALLAGVDLNCGVAFRELFPAYQAGLITEDDIDRNLWYLLRTRFRLGLFDPPGATPWDTISASVINCEAHRDMARKIAMESIVLLKNNGVLPLKRDLHRIIVTGPLAGDVNVLLGNYNGVPANAVTILEGIATAVDPGTRITYHSGYLLTGEDPKAPRRNLFHINNADATILVMGISPLFEGEDGEALATTMGADKQDIKLPGNQVEYIRELSKNKTKPLIVVVTGGSPLDLSPVMEIADAVLFAWYPGEQGGNAIANILFGLQSPSGRLPITFPASVEQLPPFTDYSMKGRTYKYMTDKSLFPFGFGLSYTSFAYGPIQVNHDTPMVSDSIELRCTVRNTGTRASAEVVQCYISHHDMPFRVPIYELIGFQRVFLEPGEATEVVFCFGPEVWRVVNMEGMKVAVKGSVTFFVGGSLPDDRSRELGAPMCSEKRVGVD
jgi:beta-glucosidase